MKKEVMDAIDLGRIWMKNSLDLTHGFEHASLVEKHALEIAKEYVLPNDEVLAAVWWHDSYKARCKRVRIVDIFIEGVRAAKIFDEEVGDFFDSSSRVRIYNAILVHNNPLYFILKGRSVDKLALCLYESDNLDGYNKERFRVEMQRTKNPVVKIFIKLVSPIIKYIFEHFISQSNYAKKILYESK